MYRIWLNDKQLKNVPSSSEVTNKKAFNLRQNMLLFVQNLEYYMFEEVIETQWQTFMSAINKKVLIFLLIILNYFQFYNFPGKKC